MTEYDAFLFASVCETDEMTLSVLSVLARLDIDPWQEADRLAQLSRDQAINSLASKIWQTDSERWSPSEASILAVRLIDLLPSHGCSPSSPPWTGDRDSTLTFWIIAGMLMMSIGVFCKESALAAGPAVVVYELVYRYRPSIPGLFASLKAWWTGRRAVATTQSTAGELHLVQVGGFPLGQTFHDISSDEPGPAEDCDAVVPHIRSRKRHRRIIRRIGLRQQPTDPHLLSVVLAVVLAAAPRLALTGLGSAEGHPFR